jgi:hypothetical protein
MIIPNSHRNSKSHSNMLLVDIDNSSVCSSTGTFLLVEVSKHLQGFKNETYSNTQICKEDCIEFWYNGSDYRDFKTYNRSLVRHISKHEQMNRNPSLYQRTLLRTYKACLDCTSDSTLGGSVLTTTEERQLRRVMQLSTPRLGLERSSIRAIHRDGSYRRQNIVQAVMEIQDEMEQLICKDVRAQYLRQACESISRPSCIFARQLAQAQAPDSFL